MLLNPGYIRLSAAFDLLTAAEDHNVDDLARRVTELGDQLHYFVSLFESAGVWVSVGGAVLAIIVMLLVSFVGFFGFSGYLEIRRIRAELAQQVHQLESDSRANVARTEQIAGNIETRYRELEHKIETRVNFYRFFLLGQLHYDNSDFNRAYQFFRSASEFDQTPEVSYYLARCLTYRNAVEEAIEVLESLDLQEPNNPKTIRALGLAKRFIAPTEAIKLFRKALSKVGNNQRLRATIQNEIGLVCRDQRQFQEAYRCHSIANEHVHNDPVTLYFLGVASALCNKKQQGAQLIQLAATTAAYAVETQRIKGIWERTIAWSALVIEEQYDEAQKVWYAFTSAIQSAYLRDTINAHVKCISDGFQVDVSKIADFAQTNISKTTEMRSD